jgi:hypothetical protein
MDGVWHVLNFFAPALGIGVWACLLAKLLWWRSLRAVPWLALVVWAVSACAVMSMAGLLLFGQDGKMATYGAMVLGCACSLWWRGFRHSPAAVTAKAS